MHLCLDIDDTITYAPEFFSELCRRFDHAEISIVTFRTNLVEAQKTLGEIGIRYDRLVVSSDPVDGKRESESLAEWKARFVNELNPDIFFEDMPEVVALIRADIIVLMPCDDIIRDWIKSRITG